MNKDIDFDVGVIRSPVVSEMYSLYSSCILPMHLAETDFCCPHIVTEQLINRVSLRHFGYASDYISFNESVAGWMLRRHALEVPLSWVNYSPSTGAAVLYGVEMATNVGDEVIVFTPAYHVFRKIIQNSDRVYHSVPLRKKTDGYDIDFVELERIFCERKAKAIIFCNPHNPTGQVWDDAEIENLVRLCCEYNVFIIADEIYGDLVYEGNYTSLLKFRQSLKDRLMVCISPAKSFGLSGLRCGAVIIPCESLYQKYAFLLTRHKTNDRNSLSIIALQAAFNYGDDYIDQMVKYIEGNKTLMANYFKEYIPDFQLIEPQYGYMAWINASLLEAKVNMPAADFLHDFADIGVRDGTVFDNGEGYIRMSFGFPRATLMKALDKITMAISEYS